MSEAAFSIRPIGRVVCGRARGVDSEPWEAAESEIAIDAEWLEGLAGIDEFSHIWIIWWLDGAHDARLALRVHPQGRQDLPLVGLFATRSPQRPNPIAITAVRLLGRVGGMLRVQGLDAFEGSAILDIKPYLRRGDLISQARQAEWLDRL